MDNFFVNNETDNELFSIYAGKAFLKVKNALEIGKVLVTFVDKNDAKQHIDCYMDGTEFGGVLMRFVNNGMLRQLLEKERARAQAAKEQYCKAVWTSKLGGTTTDKDNNVHIARKFDIAPGTSQELVLTAYQYPADNIDGKFVPKKDAKPDLTLRVGCSFNELLELQYAWSFLADDWGHKRYNMISLRDTFRELNSGDDKPQTKDTKKDKPKNEAPKNTVPAAQTPENLIRGLRSCTHIIENASEYRMQAKLNDKLLSIIIPKKVVENMSKDEWGIFFNNCNAGSYVFNMCYSKCENGIYTLEKLAA